MSDPYAGVQNVARVSSVEGSPCAECDQALSAYDDFTGCVEHYIKQHGYRLLHVGMETETLSEGLGHSTVAILGK